jgi:hypothetical protein
LLLLEAMGGGFTWRSGCRSLVVGVATGIRF